MQRLRPYLNAFVWQAGLGYLALWAVTLWTLHAGARLFGGSQSCRPDAALVLFYWVCERGDPLAILAAVVNFALTVTVWAPVYVAAATVRPDAVALALPILLVHAVGLPAAMFVLIRLMLKLFDARRLITGLGRSGESSARQSAATPNMPAGTRDNR